jgi:predicted GNAT family acetyltransferase
MTNKIHLSPAVVRNSDLRRFEMRVGSDVAYLSYTEESGRVSFDHTHVPEGLRGKGVAATLVRGALEAARQHHWKIVPRCSYVAGFLERNPEFADLVDRRE